MTMLSDDSCAPCVQMIPFHSIRSCIEEEKREMLDLIVVVVTVISFVALIEFTIGCDRL